jgi:hypothetical protein
MVIALLLLMLAAGLQQDPPKEPKENKPPKRGDTVVAKGCLKGSVLETSDLSGSDGTSAGLIDLVTFRLTGDKKMLQQLKKEHDGHADVLTGELRTDLPTSTFPIGKKVGNSRITVGVGASRGMMPEPPPPMPVLKVTSFEHTGATCR